MEQMSKRDNDTVHAKTVDSLECDVCGKTFKSKYKFKRHREIHKDRKKYKCEECGKTLTGKDSYNRHSKRHKKQGDEQNNKQEVSDNKKPIVVCKVCGQIFSSMNAFRIHKKKHLGIRYYCTRCALSFTTTDQLKLHEKAHDDVRNFHCLQCSSTFKRKSNLTRHMAIHEGTKKCVCHICGKAFVLNESLATHMKVHEDSPLLSCDICQATFKYENSLKTHQKLHSNLKEFKCMICNREFLRKRTLEDHLKCHEKGTSRVALLLKPSEFCTLCSKGFANAYGLRRHLRKHRLGILKHYNRVCGKNSTGISDGIDSISQDVKTKKTVPKRNKVAVYSNLVDNGSLFEKIDPKCFSEMSSDNAEDHSKLKKYVESKQNNIENILMTDNCPKPIEDFEDVLKATDEVSFNKEESASVLNSLETGLVSSFSLKFSTEEPETNHKTVDSVCLNVEAFDHDSSASAESDDHYDELEETSKVSQKGNIDEKVGNDNSVVAADTEHSNYVKDIEKATDFIDINKHLPKGFLNSDSLINVDTDLIDGPKDDNVTEQYFDTSKYSSNGNVTLIQTVIFSDQTYDDGSKIEVDLKADNLKYHDEKITENFAGNVISEKDIKWVDRIGEENLGVITASETEESAVIKENQENLNGNHNIDTDDESFSLECTICRPGKRFKNDISFKRHKRKRHQDNSECRFQCLKCLQQFHNKTEYETHVRKENLVCHNAFESEATKLQCKFCMTNYSSQKSLKMHLRRYHKDEDGTIFTCAQCGKMFASKILYRNHMDFHIIGKSNVRQLCECDVCGSEHKSILALRRHKRVSHGIEEDDIFSLDAEDDGISERENQMEIRGDNTDRAVFAEVEVNNDKDVNAKHHGVERLDSQLYRYEEFKSVSNEVIGQNTSNLYTQSINQDYECMNQNVDQSDKKDNEIDSKNEEDQFACVQDTNQIVYKRIETYNDRRSTRRRDLYTDNSNVFDGKPNQDLSSNNSTKERFQRKFQCIECDKNFHMMSTLKQHMLGHKKQSYNETKMFPCGQCDQKFARKSQLMTHTHKFHSKFTYSCNLCPRKFTSVYCLRTHKCVKLGQSKYVDKIKLSEKSSIKSRQADYKCDVCDEMFTKHCCFQVHLLTHSTGSYQCPLCKVSFTKWFNFKRHKISKHGKEVDSNSETLSKLSTKEDTLTRKIGMNFTCSLCSVSLSSESNLNRHMKIKHKKTNIFSNSESCNECKEILKELRNEQELRKVRKKRTFPCESCDQTFPTKLTLRKHQKSVHKEIFNYCNLCSKEFSSLSNLKRHESIHHSGGDDVQRNFMCSECGRCFTAKDSLRVHMFSHTGERPYKCKQCDASYSRSSHLLRHVKVSHEGKLNFVCNYEGCGKRFYEASVLRIHQRSHTDERPYPCPHCPQSFRTMNNKKAHLKTHLLVKQFECHICFQGLTSKHSLMKHLDRHEAAEKMNPNSARFDPNFRANVRQKVVKKMEEKRFGCSYCSKTFTTTRGVYAHQRKYCESAKKAGFIESNDRYYELQSSL